MIGRSEEIAQLNRLYDSRESELSRKLTVFQAVTKTRQALHPTLITSFGLMRNKHSGRVQSEVTLDDLFKE